MVLDALASVCNQRQAVQEIVVVNDGSKDDTSEQIAARFPEVHLVELPGLGPGQARNAGAAEATGDAFMFLDSDDRWLPHHVHALAKVLNDGFHVAYGTTRTIDEIQGGFFNIPDQPPGPEGDCYNAMARWCFTVPSAMAVSRHAFYETGGFGSEEFGEDWAFFLRLASRFSFGFARDAGPITLRRLHQGSLCANPNRRQLLAIVNRLLDIVAEMDRQAPENTGRLRQIAAWMTDHNKHWQTVQEWYVAMEKEGLL
ncbi:MAG: hypothetical protein A2521_07295 [Deltaproteobacteria bacterium RIFOXYD12_FULL_57_12]|nr:MAG: hypothetical protein A2521_07295 [Deltaproteobacteria bacterium RIFOXYD12_FULL_57_12]